MTKKAHNFLKFLNKKGWSQKEISAYLKLAKKERQKMTKKVTTKKPKRKLSQTKRAIAMRKMRREETPEQKEKRLKHERELYNTWKKNSLRINKLESNAKTYKKAVNVLKKSAKKRIKKNGKI